MTLTLPLLAIGVVLIAWPSRASWGSRWRWRWRLPGLPSRRRVGVGDELAWLDALVAELTAGRDPVSALLVAPDSGVLCPAAATAAHSGGDVAAAMRRTATTPVMLGAAACWEVAQGSGAGLAASLTTLADSARDAERVRAELRAGLAEPRATAVVLSALPLLGLALGSALGARPVDWLLGSAAGRAVLAGGVLLEALGVWWSWCITRSLEASL